MRLKRIREESGDDEEKRARLIEEFRQEQLSEKLNMNYFVSDLKQKVYLDNSQTMSVSIKLGRKLTRIAESAKTRMDFMKPLTVLELDLLLKESPSSSTPSLQYLTMLVAILENGGRRTILQRRDFDALVIDLTIDAGAERNRRKRLASRIQ